MLWLFDDWSYHEDNAEGVDAQNDNDVVEGAGVVVRLVLEEIQALQCLVFTDDGSVERPVINHDNVKFNRTAATAIHFCNETVKN